MRRMPLWLLCLLILTCAGCPGEGNRVAEVAREGAREQAEQNERMVQLQQEVAESHTSLVEGQSNARGEMIALQHDLQKAQTDVSQQRDSLETERREMAAQRGRDPIIAAAIQYVGLLLACLLPLLVCIYVLRASCQSDESDAAVTEILIKDWMNDEPTIFPPARPLPALRHEADTDVPDRLPTDQ